MILLCIDTSGSSLFDVQNALHSSSSHRLDAELRTNSQIRIGQRNVNSLSNDVDKFHLFHGTFSSGNQEYWMAIDMLHCSLHAHCIFFYQENHNFQMHVAHSYPVWLSRASFSKTWVFAPVSNMSLTASIFPNADAHLSAAASWAWMFASFSTKNLTTTKCPPQREYSHLVQSSISQLPNAHFGLHVEVRDHS